MEGSLAFLSEVEKSLLIDGYTRNNNYNGKYIAIELCNLIILFYKNHFNCDFIIIFEKYKDNDEYLNEMFGYDMELKTKIIKNNELWKYNFGAAYCVHETKNDYLVFRVGGKKNKETPNVEYSINN